MVDELSFLSWSKTKDAEKNRNRPKSVLEIMTSKPKENDVKGFKTGEQFEAARAAFFGV